MTISQTGAKLYKNEKEWYNSYNTSHKLYKSIRPVNQQIFPVGWILSSWLKKGVFQNCTQFHKPGTLSDMMYTVYLTCSCKLLMYEQGMGTNNWKRTLLINWRMIRGKTSKTLYMLQDKIEIKVKIFNLLILYFLVSYSWQRKLSNNLGKKIFTWI